MTNVCSVIEGGYIRDILEQPAALQRTVDAFRPDPELLSIGTRMREGGFRHVVLTGMGSSYHAFHPLLIDLTELGVPATLVETSELIHYRRRLLTPDTVVVVLSQSGRSAETIRLLEVNAGSALLIAVTNDGESPLAREATARITMLAGPEYTVSCKTYLASLAALAWLSDHLSGADLSRSRDDLALLAPAVESYLCHREEYTRNAQHGLGAMERLFYVGRGPSLASAGTAGLITKESARFPAEGMSAAAFRHGPLELVDGRVFLVAFEGNPQTAELNHRLARDVKMAGGRSVVIKESEQPALFHTPPVPLRLRPVVEMLPVQMITLALAAMAGREAGAFALATKITASE